MNPLEPAFPFIDLNDDGSPCRQWPGLTKREYFAALAMQGLCASEDFSGADETHVAKISVRQADALIAALNAEPQS